MAVAAIALIACNSSSIDPQHYFSAREADSLLVDMVTYIYSKPPGATNENRFDNKYRTYYIRNAKNFSFEYYYTDSTSTSYFYLIRPARSLKGNLRGVGGKFKLSNSETGSKRLLNFEEIFNTTVMPVDSLKMYGQKIMKYMRRHHHYDPFKYDPAIIEWPGKHTMYDTIRMEWVYSGYPSDTIR